MGRNRFVINVTNNLSHTFSHDLLVQNLLKLVIYKVVIIGPKVDMLARENTNLQLMVQNFVTIGQAVEAGKR